MAQTPPSSSPQQAKITQRLAVRTALLLFVLAGLFGVFRYFQSLGGDLSGVAEANTSGMIAAIELRPDGQQAVVFTSEGKVIRNKGYAPEVIDRDLAWNASGNRLFFVSNRKDQVNHIYRWNPTVEAEPEPRTTGKRGRSNPIFPVEEVPGADETALITSGGFVLEFDPKRGSTRQVLPPVGREIAMGTEEGSGADSQFGTVYSKLGESFRIAQWCKGKKYIAAVMRRDQGEVLIVQNMQPTTDQEALPQPLVAAERIDFAVDPKTGNIVYTVLGFQWTDPDKIPEQFIQNNKVTKPFENAIAMFDPAVKEASRPLAISNVKNDAFISPAISPDGSTLVVVYGEADGTGSIRPQGLVSMPVRENGGAAGTPVARGEIYEPSWFPSGNSLVFVRREGGKRVLFSVNRDGSSERNISGENGNFATPKVSPKQSGG